MISGAEVVARARSANGHGCVYALKTRGGMTPTRPVPWDDNMTCDCSGFVAWALGVSRWVRDNQHPLYGTFAGEWIETTAIYDDATSDSPGAFVALPWPEARIGDLLVYGDRGKQQGHVAVVSEVNAGGPSMIVHCSSGNQREVGDAIAETIVRRYWSQRQAVVARCSLVAA